MILITKEEAAYLRSKYGNDVYITKQTKHGKRYAPEIKKVLRSLEEYRRASQQT